VALKVPVLHITTCGRPVTEWTRRNIDTSIALSRTSALRRHGPSLKELDKVQHGCLSWETGHVYLYRRIKDSQN
jgi:hypothetical protein